MMTPTELIAAITLLGRRERVNASIAIRLAAKIRDDRERRLRLDLAKATEGERAKFAEEEEGKAKMLDARAELHNRRATAAEKGYVFYRSDIDILDSDIDDILVDEYTKRSRDVIGAAEDHGVAVDHWPLKA
jgi:hypothetical protein